MKTIETIFCFLLVAVLLVFPKETRADYTHLSEVHMQVLLISIQNYEMAPLKYANNDIEKLSAVFQTRLGATSQAIIDRKVSSKTYKASIEESISTWCRSLKKEDTCILYLAGHGLVGPDGRLYLPMVDFKKDNFDTAAIPMQWIREQLSNAEGKCKLILLDTCFSGTSRDLEVTLSNSIDMANEFDGIPGVATIASSQENQRSWLWTEQKHSLYTYWLIEGFRGNADKNGDMVLSIDELFNYLDEKIAWISSDSKEGMEPQNPVLMNDSQIKSAFHLPLFIPSPQSMLENAASQIDLLLRHSEPGMVVVPEFITGMSGDPNPSIQPNYGSLPRTLACTLQRELATCSSSKTFKPYQVLNFNATSELLNENHLTPADLGTKKSRNLVADDQVVKYLVLGRLYYNPNRPEHLEMEISLLDAASRASLGFISSRVRLTGNELAEMGISGTISSSRLPEEGNEYLVSSTGLARPNDLYAVAEMLQTSRVENPMQSSNSPYKVEIYVRKAGSRDKLVLREGKSVGNDYYIPLDKGEEYQIWVYNNSDSEQFVRVLVDGMNTLSQPIGVVSKGVELVATQVQKSELAPVVNLESARAWVPSAGHVLKVEGFYDVNDTTPSNSGMYRFMLGDADQSLGARKSYTEKLGRITIGIYNPVAPGSARGGVATTTQEVREQREMKFYDGKFIPSAEPAVIYNLRYLSREEYDKL